MRFGQCKSLRSRSRSAHQQIRRVYIGVTRDVKRDKPRLGDTVIVYEFQNAKVSMSSANRVHAIAARSGINRVVPGMNFAVRIVRALGVELY